MRIKGCLLVAIISLGFIVFWVLLMFAMDEHWQAITFENHTETSIKVDTRGVPLDFTGPPPSFTYDIDVVPINAGESKKFGTTVPDGRSTGVTRKYSVVAVNEANELVFFKVFTWDELHDSDWKVTVTQQK